MFAPDKISASMATRPKLKKGNGLFSFVSGRQYASENHLAILGHPLEAENRDELGLASIRRRRFPPNGGRASPSRRFPRAETLSRVPYHLQPREIQARSRSDSLLGRRPTGLGSGVAKGHQEVRDDIRQIDGTMLGATLRDRRNDPRSVARRPIFPDHDTEPVMAFSAT